MTREQKRVWAVMFREQICSEHGARCFIVAKARDRKAKRLNRPLPQKRTQP